jgi:hypothetical protein
MVSVMAKKPKSFLAIGLAATAASLALSSCADPYYGGGGYASGGYSSGYPGYGSSYGAGYSSGYGQGYGYGGSSFSTTTFISTSSPRWGYDPSVRAYYDYNRRAYYDPYLYGYYPVGYRPVVVYAAPHPYGWRPGYTTIAPPSRITSVTLSNYDRHSAYRRSDYSWARQIEAAPAADPRRNPRQFDTRDTRGGRPTYQQGNQRPTYPQTYQQGSQRPTYQSERAAPIDPLYSTSTQGRSNSSQGRAATTQQPYVQPGRGDVRVQGVQPAAMTREMTNQPLQTASGGVGRPTKVKPANRGTQTAEEAIEEARSNGASAQGSGRFR